MPTMLNVIEPEKRSSNLVSVSVAVTPALLYPKRGGSHPGHANPDRLDSSTHCLWCGRAFTPRTTGGSPQRFCSTRDRQAFWIAARRWTMRAVEAGLFSVDCLKAAHSSVHAA
jgi:hypothetical protein